ncbi:MAG TPA: hypothetical protein P5114_04545 [Hyphomicrobiaceae bacterium]|nr:hypothetical protein [Hyphomicrobiaceae bacterium]
MSKKTSADRIVQVGAGLVATALVAYLGISYKYFNDVPVGCMANYPQAVRFGLQSSDGMPLSMIELQARAGREERGLMQNARIVNVADAPMPRVLEVKLGRADETNPDSPVGVNFPWRPDGKLNAHSGCMRYSVFLPEDFNFSVGGILPGMFGGPTPNRSELTSDEAFALRTQWDRDGHAQVYLQSKALNENGRMVVTEPGSVDLKRGHWVTLEQELVLNTAGANDGEVQVWINGERVVEKKGLKLREGDAPGLNGVAVTVGLAGKSGEVPASTTRLQITPIDFGWR